jgi:lysophospholipase L1-like esterase
MRALFLFVFLCVGCAAPAAPAPFAADIAAFEEADRAAQPAPCQVLFVGSSSIRFWNTLAEDMAPMRVIRRGFGGSAIADVNRYFDRIVAPYRPAAIVFYAGENDIDQGATPEATVALFERFMAMKRRALGATPVYFISLKPSRLRAAQLDRQRAVNEAIAAMAARRDDLEYIDVASPMAHAPDDIYLADGLHMNAAGYAIWTREVRAALAQSPPTHAPGCG